MNYNIRNIIINEVALLQWKQRIKQINKEYKSSWYVEKGEFYGDVMLYRYSDGSCKICHSSVHKPQSLLQYRDLHFSEKIRSFIDRKYCIIHQPKIAPLPEKYWYSNGSNIKN